MKKNNLLTFCFAFIPGAGQMYLGMMKRGASLMLIFSILTALAGFLGLGLLSVFLPVIWFYAFFDTFNLRAMTYEQRLLTEDKFLFDFGSNFQKDWLALLKKRHLLVGGVFIFLGVYSLYQNFIVSYLWNLEERFPLLASMLRRIPSLVVAFAIIFLGVYLVRGGAGKAQKQEKDFVEFGGKNDEPRK